MFDVYEYTEKTKFLCLKNFLKCLLKFGLLSE